MAVIFNKEDLKKRTDKVIEEDRTPLIARIAFPGSTEINTGENVISVEVHEYDGTAKVSTDLYKDSSVMHEAYSEKEYKPKYIHEAIKYDRQEMLKLNANPDKFNRSISSVQRIVRITDEEFLLKGDDKLGIKGFFNSTGSLAPTLPNGGHGTATAVEIVEDFKYMLNTLESEGVSLANLIIVDKSVDALWESKLFSADNPKSAKDEIVSQCTSRGIQYQISRKVALVDLAGNETFAIFDAVPENMEIIDHIAEGESELNLVDLTPDEEGIYGNEWVCFMRVVPAVHKPNKIAIAQGTTV